MGKVERNLIEYNGIGTCKSNNIPNFRQMNLDYVFCIPSQKPDIEQVVKVWVTPCIISQKILKTPKGTSLEGQTVTGYKLLIDGDITIKVEYVALETEQSLHTAHTTIPFCGYVVLPKDFNTNAIVRASALVEDIYSEQLDLRCIYNNITMMLIADVC